MTLLRFAHYINYTQEKPNEINHFRWNAMLRHFDANREVILEELANYRTGDR